MAVPPSTNSDKKLRSTIFLYKISWIVQFIFGLPLYLVLVPILQRRLPVLTGLIHLSKFSIRCGPVVIGKCIGRFQFNGFTQVLDGTMMILEEYFCKTPVIVSRIILRIEFNRF